MKSAGRVALKVTLVFIAILFGIVGGALCGAAILSFGALIGRSGSTGTEYVGYWVIDLVWLGFLYGGLLGAFVTPIAYVILVKKIGFQKALIPATIGTLLGGFVGAIVGPPFAVVTGVAGFFGAITWAVQKHRIQTHSDSPQGQVP
jgi:hypothetical protein